MKDRKSRSVTPTEAQPDFTHAHRILQKMLDGGSATADYMTVPYLSAIQSKKARHSRPDELSKLIIDIASDNPKITASQLFYKLKKNVGQGVIVSMTADDSVEWRTSAGKPMKTSVLALKDRLSRAKNCLKKDSL